jgi:nucleotide-binding universal stress UspA family protein
MMIVILRDMALEASHAGVVRYLIQHKLYKKRALLDFNQWPGWSGAYAEGVTHPQGVAMFKHILVPTDGSKLSFKALDFAAELANSVGARVSVLYVVPNYPTMVGGDGYMVTPIAPKEWETSMIKGTAGVQAHVEKYASAKSLTVQFLSVAADLPHEAIIDTATHNKCDLIIMASHGRKGLSALLLGSETTKVLTHCKLPVLVCR